MIKNLNFDPEAIFLFNVILDGLGLNVSDTKYSHLVVLIAYWNKHGWCSK